MNCDKPDRDEPRLKCGYPMPCPHHTVVLAQEDLALTIPTVAWLAGIPNVAIGAFVSRIRKDQAGQSMIGVRAIASFRACRVWSETRYLPATSPMSSLRDAFDELTRIAHLELEKQDPTAELPEPAIGRIRLPRTPSDPIQVSKNNGPWKDVSSQPFEDDDDELRAAYKAYYPCKVCMATPDDSGVIEHGKGCYEVQSEGGGTEDAAPTFAAWKEGTR